MWIQINQREIKSIVPLILSNSQLHYFYQCLEQQANEQLYFYITNRYNEIIFCVNGVEGEDILEIPIKNIFNLLVATNKMLKQNKQYPNKTKEIQQFKNDLYKYIDNK